MKDQRFNKSVSSSIPTKAHRLKGVKPETIRKNNPEDVILRRIKEYLLYTRLRSLIPAQASELKSRENGDEKATEMELEHDEIPAERDSDEEEEQEEGCSVVVIEQEEGTKAFVPSVKIKKMEGSLLINTIVHKDLALTSALFKILEEEEQIDVVFENQYRTESKVAHTIHVRVGADYNAELLEKKLCRWAGKPM